MKGLVIWIRTETKSGESLLDDLGRDIRDRGGRVEVFHSKTVEDLGMEKNDRAKAIACAMLAGHGIVVLASGTEKSGLNSGDTLEIREVEESELRLDELHDSFLRNLELAGLIPPPRFDVNPDEEKEILKKLQDLGYIDSES